MEKLTIVSNLTKSMDVLRNTECGKKEKLIHFHQISECLLSQSLITHDSYTKLCSSAISILLFFCEDLDSTVGMNAEENLNRIMRSLEINRMSRIFLDLYHEIKKNGNEKSLRICLNLFSYYCPRIKEKNVKWYALKLLPCIQAIAMRKEILLIETLSEFMKNFGKYLQICLNDNETLKLMEVFLSNIVSNCSVKRRCSALNCMYLIENSRNRTSMSRYGLNKALEILVNSQEINTVLGVLGLLRLLLPFIISENACDYQQIIEIYDFCLHLLNNMNHSIINASLEIINSILSQSNRELEELFTSDQLQHNEVLKKKKSLKNQILNRRKHIGAIHSTSKGVEKTRMTAEQKMNVNNAVPLNKHIQNEITGDADSIEIKLKKEPVEDDCEEIFLKEISDVTIKTNELHEDSNLEKRIEEKPQVFVDIDNESCNSIDFESEIAITQHDNEYITASSKDDNKSVDIKSQKSTDSSGSFFNSFLSVSTAETMTKLFRTSANQKSATVTNTLSSNEKDPLQNSTILMPSITLDSPSFQPKPSTKLKFETSNTLYHSLPTITNSVETDTSALPDNAISLQSINSYLSQDSNTLLQSCPKGIFKNKQDLILNETNTQINPKMPQGQANNEMHKKEHIIENTETENGSTAKQFFSDSDKQEETVFKEKHTIVNNDDDYRDEIKKKDTINIGTIYTQTIIKYTVRLIAHKFLLTGKSYELMSDTNVRVSIKNLSLNVIANCVRLEPKILRITMEIDKVDSMYSRNDGFELLFEMTNDESNEVENGFQMNEQIKTDNTEFLTELNTHIKNDNLLEIKDDHFGECTTAMLFLLNSSSGKSADETLTSQLKDVKSSKENEELSQQKINNIKLSNQLQQVLSKSEIVETKSRTDCNEERPNRKEDGVNEELNCFLGEQKQHVYDILLFYNHSDPILRGNVQIIIGNFIYGLLLSDVEYLLNEPWNLHKLLAILIKGLKDEIHTVVIQALTSFDKIFPLLTFNYHKLMSKQIVLNDDGNDNYKDASDNIDLDINNEFFIGDLLNTKVKNFDDQKEDKEKNFSNENVNKKLITPKILLDQLILCYHNKYWVAQNKYSEVISNLKCYTFREYCDDDTAYFYEDTFLKQLIHFLGDDDIRVREHTAECLRNFIESNSHDNNFINEIYNADLNLLREFFDYRIFLGISKPLRDLLNEGRFITSKKEKLLSKSCYLMANKLMKLKDKNLQFGVIFAVKKLIYYFNPLDYAETWNEFNFIEICLTFAIENYAIGTDLQCQNDLMEIITRLLAANTLAGKVNDNLIDMLLVHTLKLLNIYHHLFSNQKPILFMTPHRSDLFSSTKETITSNSIGYFGNDYFYIKLYNTLKSAYDAYKISINKESGLKLLTLLTSCLHTLSACLDIKAYSTSFPLLKLIEEILQYLTILINYEPTNTIYCVRQLLKYLFGRNYGNRKNDYEQFLKTYFAARKITSQRINFELGGHNENNKIFKEMFANTMSFPLHKIKSEEESIKYIKLFEPLVIYCLTLFMKSNATIQAPILELLSQLLEFNVTYSILDSKNVIYEQVMKNLDLIETGIARNATTIIWAVIRFLIALTKQNDKKLITIPKVISIINGLLATSGIKLYSVLALKALAFEIFFTQNSITSPNHRSNDSSLNAKELNTQREVVHGMLEKFVSCFECQKTLAILALWNKVWSEQSSIQGTGLFSVVIKGMECGQIKVENLESFSVLDGLFRNNNKNVFSENNEFLSSLTLFVTKSVDNFSDLSQVIIILDNVLLRIDNAILINHIKIFLESNQLCYDELHFFSKILFEKLKRCFSTLIKYPSDDDYCCLVVKYLKSLVHICNMTAFNTSFKSMLEEIFFCKRYQLTYPNTEYFQTEFINFICDLNMNKMLLVLYLKEVNSKKNQKILIRQICNKFNDSSMWTVDEVKNLFSTEFFEDLIDSNSSLLTSLFRTTENNETVFRGILSNISILKKLSLLNLIKLIREMKSISPSEKFQFLSDIHDRVSSNKTIKILIDHATNQEVMLHEETIDNQKEYDLVSNSDLKRNKQKTIVYLSSTEEKRIENIINDYEVSIQEGIDEKWLIEKIIKLSSVQREQEYARILLDIKSEFKLKSIFSAINCDVKNLLKTCIRISFDSMISSFRNNCVIHNPHIHYMNMNALLKISLNMLINQLRDFASQCNNQFEDNSEINIIQIASTITILLRKVEQLEMMSLMYVEHKIIQKFIREQIFKDEQFAELLIIFCCECSKRCNRLLNLNKIENRFFEIYTFYECIDSILRQNFIWLEINKFEKYVTNLHTVLDMLYDGMIKPIRNTDFFNRYEAQVKRAYDNLHTKNDNNELNNKKNVGWIEKAMFVGKLIETKIDAVDIDNFQEMQIDISMRVLNSIAISLLRTNLYYVYAVTPLEVFYSCGSENNFLNTSKSLSIPLEYLSDADVLQKFVKRLFIFGFSTRQQFEEYFMSFLLLINKVYDENMVDEEEQFQIKCICLAAILELLITCKSFPSVGSRLSKFHHSTRLSKIKCDNISLKKLHKVQLVIPGSNVFYQPNLERKLSQNYYEESNYTEIYRRYLENNVIGTNLFLPNQYGLNHVWQLMENQSNEPNSKENSIIKNIPYFVDTSGIDLKSSLQLIFDVLMQLIEANYFLVLPNLVKFCEICENRDQIKLIKDSVIKLQESIPIDDTVSHQCIIYLLCKTQSVLIPSSGDLAHLCSIVSTYLKSTHVFIRNATLHGLLCLLESCSKTNTSIGKLSEELTMVRDVIIEYISRHGIIEESSMQFSDMHTKLVWTLNFYLIEMTFKFVPDCKLLSNSIISANNLLKRTTNEDIYLCILHGLERTILISSVIGTMQSVSGKIEKLAVELAKKENEIFSLPAFKLLLSCIYIGSSKQLENTEYSNGIVQDDPEIIVQYTEKVDFLLHRIKSSTANVTNVYGQVLCQIIRDLVPPNEILTKVIKEFLAINQPYSEVIARIVYQVFRSAIDSSFLQMLQDWLICSLPTFMSLPIKKGIWCLTVIFLSASINLNLIKLFPIVLNEFNKFSVDEIELFVTSSRDFYRGLNTEQKERFEEAFRESELEVYHLVLKKL